MKKARPCLLLTNLQFIHIVSKTSFNKFQSIVKSEVKSWKGFGNTASRRSLIFCLLSNIRNR